MTTSVRKAFKASGHYYYPLYFHKDREREERKEGNGIIENKKEKEEGKRRGEKEK